MEKALVSVASTCAVYKSSLINGQLKVGDMEEVGSLLAAELRQ